MYSWDKDLTDYRYDGIQYSYEIEEYDEENDEHYDSLIEGLSEEEFNEEFAL